MYVSIYLLILCSYPRLKDERSVTELIEHAQKYLEKQTQPGRDADLCRIYMRRIDHLYYKVNH